MPHHPYSPDLTQSDFLLLLFSWVNKTLMRKHFANGEELKQKMAEAVKDTKSISSKTVLSSGKKSR